MHFLKRKKALCLRKWFNSTSYFLIFCIRLPDYSVQILVRLPSDGIPQFVHLLSHLLEEIWVRLFWVLVRLLLLSTLLSPLMSIWLSSCCSYCLISWFCLVSSSTMAASDWICRANAAESWLVVDSIWTFELDGTVLYNYVSKSNHLPTNGAELMMLESLVKCDRLDWNRPRLARPWKWEEELGCIGVVLTTKPPMPKLESRQR